METNCERRLRRLRGEPGPVAPEVRAFFRELERVTAERDQAREELQHVSRLYDEIKTAHEGCRTTLEQLRATSELLASATEQLEAVIEELRATTQVLDDMNADLQETNADLQDLGCVVEAKQEKIGALEAELAAYRRRPMG